jgi:two-component system, NtrC family, nitrogen regulation sensor histidine kinase NtrY
LERAGGNTGPFSCASASFLPNLALMKLRTRITLSMLSLVVFSLLVIGIVTIWFFSEQNEEYHRERLQRKERAIKTEMDYFSKEVELQEARDVVVREFEEELLKLASAHRLEINVFNTNGEMLVSARPDSIHSEYIHRRVPATTLEELESLNRIIIPEREDGRDYLSDYTNLYNSDGERIAILHIPYLQDINIAEKDLENFLGSIGLVYLFIFMGGIFLTFLLSRSITRNLTALSERMQRVDLNGENEPFNWRSDDEVGKLVDTYNAMLLKLEESRQELTKQERESAWREMARQVAHEIKNPLTPIRLSVQHLQATAAYDDPVWREKFKRTMQTIIQQIDALSRIATEFSDFAKMPKAQIERVHLQQSIQEVAELFADVPFKLTLELPEEPVWIDMDREQLGRVLNNLLKNAKHAVAEAENPAVHITLKTTADAAEVEIKDNGAGVPEELKDKIFRPNFTTKSSGTGLGLSISSQIMDSVGGSIAFESVEGGPTSFFLRFQRSSSDDK